MFIFGQLDEISSILNTYITYSSKFKVQLQIKLLCIHDYHEYKCH
jgi:hypothetical protein